MDEAIARKWAAEKAAKEKKRAARKAAAEKRAEDAAARAEKTARVQVEKKRAVPESREEEEDQLSLRHRQRRVPTIPVLTLSEDEPEGGQAPSQANQLDSSSLLHEDQAPLFQPFQESLEEPLHEAPQQPLLSAQPSRAAFFTEKASRVGAELFKQLLLPTDQVFLKSMPPTPRYLEGVHNLLAVSFFFPFFFSFLSILTHYSLLNLPLFPFLLFIKTGCTYDDVSL